MLNKSNRRDFLKTTAVTSAALGAGIAPPALAAPASIFDASNIYMSKLGLKPIINGVGTVTNLGGSLMPPEVVQAMLEASRYFVPFHELQEKVGARIAELLQVPAALVTCGAASAITCAAAACVCSGDPAGLRQLPDTRALKDEIILQKSHRNTYESQMTLVGTKIIEVETRRELEAAINPRTAMMFFLNKSDPLGRIQRREWIEVGRQRGVPTFNDAAADVPPVERLWEYVHEGFDLVAFSGGKGLMGPQATGLLLGRTDLVQTAQQAISPHSGIGRGMKVGKEEMMGLLAAVERYLRVDHEAERRELESRALHVIQALTGIDHVRAERHVPEIANQVPHVAVSWDEEALQLSTRDLVRRLRDGNPPIWVSAAGEGGILISMWMLQGEEHKIVAGRLQEALSA